MTDMDRQWDARPVGWRALAARIKFERAGGRCERCGVPNHALGGRAEGKFFPALPLGENRLRLEWPTPGMIWACSNGQRIERLRVIRVALTIAHLDQNPANNDPANLAALCQRCHLRHDRQRWAVGDLFD